jgi:hypothetical protein
MLKYKKLHITYANPHDLGDQLVVDYSLRDTTITKKWIQRVELAQQLGYVIDDPARFYGFGSLEEQIHNSVTNINAVIKKLNQWV